MEIAETFEVAFERDIEGTSAACETELAVVDWLAAFNQTPVPTAMNPAAAPPISVRMESSTRVLTYLDLLLLSSTKKGRSTYVSQLIIVHVRIVKIRFRGGTNSHGGRASVPELRALTCVGHL
jgi:hypothetical protein